MMFSYCKVFPLTIQPFTNSAINYCSLLRVLHSFFCQHPAACHFFGPAATFQFAQGSFDAATAEIHGAQDVDVMRVLLFVLAIKTLERFPFPLSAGGVVAASLVLAFGYLQTDRIQKGIEFERRQSVSREEIGIRLRDGFPPGTLIATNAAGMIPYYSEQPTIDMLGLNDEDIAHRGKRNRGLRFAHQAGDGAYVLSRRPKVILLGPVGKRGPGKFISDREIWLNPEFHASYRPIEIVPTRWAFVRKEDAGAP